MAGHSHFKNIMRRKGAQDKKRTKLYTKVMRDLIVAVKSGMPDPNFNAKLRSAIDAARAVNMPKDKIDAAIKKAANPADVENYEAVRYEGYAPGGVAIIIEGLTDNKNRTVPEIRAALTKFGGNLGETGSVSFMFDQLGLIQYPAGKIKEEEIFEVAVEAGASDCITGKEFFEIYSEMNQLNEIRDVLARKFGDPETARLTWKPKNTIEVDEEKAKKILDMIDMLEDNDDVQDVYANFEISEEILKKIEE